MSAWTNYDDLFVSKINSSKQTAHVCIQNNLHNIFTVAINTHITGCLLFVFTVLKIKLW